MCDCGCTYALGDKARHFKTKKYIDLMGKIKNNIEIISKPIIKIECNCGCSYCRLHQKSRHEQT
jgi:hypothetical protein